MMPPQALFGISVAFSFVAWGIVVGRYIWPALRNQSRENALRPLLLLHAFRFVGLAFLIPGVVSTDLPAAFARPAAFGDLTTAILALIAFAALHKSRATRNIQIEKQTRRVLSKAAGAKPIKPKAKKSKKKK